MPTGPIAYESRRPPVRDPGEVVLWRGHPRRAPRTSRRDGWVVGVFLALALVAMVVGGIYVGADAGRNGPARVRVLLYLAAVVVPVGALAFGTAPGRALRRRIARERRRRHRRMVERDLITDRRVLRLPRRGDKPATREVRLKDVRMITVTTPWGASASTLACATGGRAGTIEFPGVGSPASAARRLLAAVHAVPRRPRNAIVDRVTVTADIAAAAPVDDPAARALIGPELADGEAVLWCARPAPPKLRGRAVLRAIAVWLWAIPPAALLRYSVPVFFGHPEAANVIAAVVGGIFGAVWLGTLVYGLTIGKLIAARTLRHTAYAITDRRVLAVTTGPWTASTQSVLLHAVDDVTLVDEDRATDTATLTIRMLTLRHVAGARPVYNLLLAAARAAAAAPPTPA